MSNVIELHSAWVWDCDECGLENFNRGSEGDIGDPAFECGDVTLSFLADGLSQIAETGDPQGMILRSRLTLFPTDVQCRHCGAEFETDVKEIFGEG